MDRQISIYVYLLIKQNYKGEYVKTLYVGGGTPSSFSLDNLKRLFDIFKIFNTNKNTEITFESNSEDLTLDKIKFLKNRINRLSIGIQTFNKKNIKNFK